MLAAVAMPLCFSAPGDVMAKWVIHGMDIGDEDDDFTTIEHYHDDQTGQYFTVFVWKEGAPSVFVHLWNPSPEDGSSGPKGDLSSRVDLAKQHGGGNWVSAQEFRDSPLGRRMASHGKGPGPVINPSDDDAGGGPGDPSRGKEKLGEPLLIDKTGAVGSGKGGGFQFNAGSPADQLKKPGGPGGSQGGGGSDDDDDKGSSGPPPGTNYGPAELVDPLGPPISRSATTKTGKSGLGALGGPDTKTGKGKSGETSLPYADRKPLNKNSGPTKSSRRGVIAIIKTGEKTGMSNPKGKLNVTAAPGLLESNAGFAAHGPSAMGSGLGARRLR